MLKKMFFEWVILKLGHFLIFIWLPWVLVAACRIFVAAHRLPTGLVTLRHVGSQFPDQLLNPSPLHCIADS